jgi:anti-sigma regulatory factor (Ser/Thr protein kinase)/CheY-like chemotaxis protein
MVRHVLLAEPASAAGPSLRQPLRQLGYTVHVAHDECPALAWARQCRPDLVVLDGCLAGLCRSLKAHRATNALPVVEVLPSGPPLCLRAEPDAELTGPATPAELESAVGRALAAGHQRQREGVLAELSLWLPSDPAELEALGEVLPEWLAGCGLAPFQVRQLALAVHEVVANAIEWGHAYERSRLVSVLGRLDAEKVAVLVRDSGPGFDRADLPHAARPGDPLSHLEVRAQRRLRDGGFGILLATGLVDHLCYNDTGNEGLLIKYLPAGGSPASAALAGAVPVA